LAKSLKRLTRTPGQTDVRLNSSTRQPASDPRSQTAEPRNNRCDVAASCPHSIFAKRLECCADRSSPPHFSDVTGLADDVRLRGQNRRHGCYSNQTARITSPITKKNSRLSPRRVGNTNAATTRTGPTSISTSAWSRRGCAPVEIFLSSSSGTVARRQAPLASLVYVRACVFTI